MLHRPAAHRPAPSDRWPARALVPLGLGVLVAGCAHAPTAATAPAPAAAHAAPDKVDTDEEYARVRADYDELAQDAPSRPATRAALAGFLLGETRREIDAGRPDEAWEAFGRALSMWEVEELNAAPPATDERVADGAAELERIYRRRGAHREVLTLLGVQIALRPADPAPRERYDEIVRWLRGADANEETCNDKACEQVIEDLESAVAVFPAPFLVERLAALYWQRHAGGGRVSRSGGNSLAQLFAGRAVARTGADLARLYLRVSRPDLALAALQKLDGQPGEDANLRDALARYVAPDGNAGDAVALASVFAREATSRHVALRVCRDTARRLPNAVESHLCVGEVATLLSRTALAVRSFERALELAPERRDSWETLARVHQARLQQLVTDERIDQLEPALRRVEAFHEAARKRFAAEPLKIPLAAAYDTVGRGLVNSGRVDDALRYFQRSLALLPSVSAYEQQAAIQLKRGHADEALSLYKQALAFLHEARRMDEQERIYWQGKLHRGLGDVDEALGAAAEAKEARRKSLEAWEQLLGKRLEPEEGAELEVERAKVLYLLGERDRAAESFARAVDAAPERGGTYADAISFLAPRGERALATELQQRALGRSISEYLKVYGSLWVLDLARLAGEPPDPAAQQFLAGVRGGKWHQQLAAWASGRLGEDELRRRADTNARRCEADFYVGVQRLGEGREDDGRALLRKVIDSQMMAFFEYEMASYYLRHPPRLPSKTAPAATTSR